MIWRRLHKATPEQEAEFAEGMAEEKPSFQEKLVMLLTAYAVLLVPAVIVLLVLVALVCLLFGIL